MENDRGAYTGRGFLRIRVTRAGGALPVEGAEVVISDYEPSDESGEGGEVLFRLTTGEGGLTQTVMLPAPSAGESLRPGAAQPYALYNVNLTYDGYYPVEGVGVPVFDRIVAVQPFELTPMGAGRSGMMIYETPDSQSLQPGGLKREDIGNRNGMISGGGYEEDGWEEEGGGEA